MTIEELNSLGIQELKHRLETCCGSDAWIETMCVIFPVENRKQLMDEAERIWFGLKREDWLQAFDFHPKIGDLSSLREKFASTATWAKGEQAAVQDSSENVLKALADGNKQYEEKFGFIFIVFATGKSAEEMLTILHNRYPNSYEEELCHAMQEQNKITKLRLGKLLDEPDHHTHS